LNKSDSLKDSNKKLKKSVRRQESSREIEDRHQDLLGHIKAVQYTHDLQGQLLSVNQGTTEFLGYDKNSLLNMNIRNLLAPEVRHEFDTYLTEMKKQGNAKGLMLVQTAAGEKRILIYNNTLQAEGVATPTVQGIAYDITKYIQTEKALRQVSGQLSIVLESLPIVCYISKAEGDYGMTYITHNIKAITGFEDTNFTLKSSFWTDRIHPEDAPRIFANLPQIFEKGYHEHQYRWQVADGSYKWFYDYMRIIISSNGKKCIIGMMQDITERKRAEEALLNAAQQWRTTFDGISDFVSLLDLDGKILRCNKAMKDFVGKPFNEIINHSCWEIILGTTTPIEDCPFLRMKETLHRETTILSVNDLWFNVSVDPIFDQASRLIGAVNIISDITKRKQAEEAVTNLSQENAIVAEIGRIISSTLNTAEVYERFAEETRKLIHFDRISVSLINCEKNTASIAYGSGEYVQGREVGDEFPLTGSAAEWVMRTRSGLLIQTESEAEVARIPGLLKIFQAGHRSMIVVPLISKDIVIGVLFLGSTRPNSYTDYDLKLAENIGNQIAGAIANAQLFIERKHAEEALQRSEEEAKRLAQENATVAEIGRIISSTLNIEEVYERFAEEVRKVLPFDRVSVNTINFDRTSITIAYAFGIKVGDLSEGAVLPLDYPFSENILNKRQGVLILLEDESELAKSYPNLVKHFRIGIRSMMTVPLISKDQVIGLLHFQSLKLDSYTESDLKLAERVGNQIAGAIANAQLFTERKQAEEALLTEKQKFQTVSENAPFGMAMTDQTGTFKYINPKFKELFGYDLSDIPDGKTWFRKAFPDPAYRHQVISTWIDDIGSQKPGEKIIRIFRVTCKDGTGKISEFSPVKLETGEHLTSFVDITHRKEAEEALRRSEEAARRLAQENATVAEIGRIISSTLNIEEVYERFAEEVRKLIQFDRITINNINPEENTFVVLYNVGLHMADREIGKPVPLPDTATEWVMQNRSSLLILEANREEMLGRIPGLLPIFKAGFCSIMLIPLISKDQVIGTLALQTAKQNAYTEVDLKLAERVTAQIAGAITNAQLFIERKRAEEAVNRLAQENAIMAEIGRIISSTLNIEEVYERFAEEVRKLIPLDRIALTTITPDHRSGTIAYVLGVEVKDRNQGAVFPLAGSFYEEIFSKQSGILVQTEDESELTERYPILLSTLKVGLRSMISVPLISKGQVIGVLHIRSLKPNAYIELDLKLAERVGNQIAGAITNAQLFIERKRAEEAVNRLAQENATMVEIGRIISSTLDINDVYERFAEKVRELVPLDRVTIHIFNPTDNTVLNAYVTGLHVPHHSKGDVMSLSGIFVEKTIRTRTTMLIQIEDLEKVTATVPELLPNFQAGIRSLIATPLISKDEVIGVLHLQSCKLNAYSEKDLRLAERVGNQIAGAIANAQLFNGRLRAEEALQKSEEEAKRLARENAIIAEIGRIISSSLNIDEVYEHFAEEVRKLIPFDRIVINFIHIEKGTVVNVYMAGKGIVDRRVEEILPLEGSGNAEMVRTKSTFLIQTEDFNEYKDHFPMLLSTFKSGFRSIMNVPLFSKGQIIGGLLLRSLKPYAYADKDVRLAERVGNQIAGAIANAQLFIEQKRAEEKMKALEDQLRQAQKMEAIGRLAGGVAHDFNNLLTVIKGYSQISLVMLKEGDPLKENVEEIEKAANRAASLTKQLLVFSRNQILELKVFYLNTILQDLDKMLHRIIGEDIELVYSLSNDLGQVKTDPSQMEQVILNLAINAKDAMPSGGKLTIETSNTTFDESYVDSHIGITPGDYVMLSVSDTGLGMTPEIKERIFEPFFTTKEKGKGTGLGLSIVYGIVKQSGGSIWVYSELGLGTTFKVFLPRIEEDAESLRPTAVPIKSLQGSETILVVEDEKIVRKLACKVLEKNGYRVLEASNGEEALHIVQKQNGNPIHLVVTDVVMPGMSGRQLIDRLVSLWPQTKALYMSGYTNDAIVHHGVLAPGIAYIQKPFTPNDLILKVRNVLDRT
jgi:PAS domain S-box-containing protein